MREMDQPNFELVPHNLLQAGVGEEVWYSD